MHSPDVHASVFTDEFFNSKTHDRGFRQRSIDDSYQGTPRRQCVDTDWQPTLQNVQEFVQDYQNRSEIYQDYDVVVVGSAIWDVVGSRHWWTSASMIRQSINETISALHEGLPSNITIVWKSSGWCNNCPWTPDENHMGRGDNYKVYAANQEAYNVIASINASNLFFLDWGREVLPRSLGADRLMSDDGNPYHYGLIPRLQLLQMLAAQLDEILAGGRKFVQSSKLMMKPAELPSDIFVSFELPSLIALVLIMVLLFCLPYCESKGKQQNGRRLKIRWHG
jgi:hypothetical protein